MLGRWQIVARCYRAPLSDRFYAPDECLDHYMRNHGFALPARVVALLGAVQIRYYAAVFRGGSRRARLYPRCFSPELTSWSRRIRWYPICVGWTTPLDV